ncbi:MAG: methyltransferase domain-containing protein [Aldersonia sp.]|nr:methyltransferase domain-containing protein [Aldersonia sp.]
MLGCVPSRSPAHADRRRAEAFGLAAEDYDRYRPRYPQSLIAGLTRGRRVRALDVGAGTGIAAVQLRRAGADVLAVEPDPRMAAVAETHGIPVEEASFEDWQPSGRTFDLVVFAQSFHWVQPDRALAKIEDALRPGGCLALLSNRVAPVRPTRKEIDDAYAGYLDSSARHAIDAAHDDELIATIEQHGYIVERRQITERLHYTTDAWVGMVMTNSNVLTLNAGARAELRARLADHIGTTGVHADNDATAVICTPA